MLVFKYQESAESVKNGDILISISSLHQFRPVKLTAMDAKE